jgi:hypothetical protein
MQSDCIRRWNNSTRDDVITPHKRAGDRFSDAVAAVLKFPRGLDYIIILIEESDANVVLREKRLTPTSL